MLRTALFILMLLCFLFVSNVMVGSLNAVQGQTVRRGSPERLKKYVDGDPWKLLKDAEVRSRLRLILGRDLKRFEQQLGQAELPELKGDILIVRGGVPQLFTLMEAVFAVDLSNGKYYAGILDQERLDFYGPASNQKDLPEAVQQWLEDLKRRKGSSIDVSFHVK
jgi:hypothetical protein